MANQPADATLLDVLIDGFEKNEMMYGFHERVLPLPSEAIAAEKFSEFVDDAQRWKGAPKKLVTSAPRRIAAWDDIEIRQEGGGLMVLVRAPRFTWWHEAQTWRDEPIGPLYDWLAEDHERKGR